MRRITKRMRAFAGEWKFQQNRCRHVIAVIRHHPNAGCRMIEDLDMAEDGIAPPKDVEKLINEVAQKYNAWLIRRGFTNEVGRNGFRHRIERDATDGKNRKEK